MRRLEPRDSAWRVVLALVVCLALSFLVSNYSAHLVPELSAGVESGAASAGLQHAARHFSPTPKVGVAHSGCVPHPVCPHYSPPHPFVVTPGKRPLPQPTGLPAMGVAVFPLSCLAAVRVLIAQQRPSARGSRAQSQLGVLVI